jgi:hypothetical protein
MFARQTSSYPANEVMPVASFAKALRGRRTQQRRCPPGNRPLKNDTMPALARRASTTVPSVGRLRLSKLKN